MDNKTRVYLFTGFLESGKTAFLHDTLMQPDFVAGEKSLLLVFEEGIEVYNETALKDVNCDVVYISDQDTLTTTYLQELHDKYQPTQVLVEFNGMWSLSSFTNLIPENWVVVQGLTTINAGTFNMYYNNMRSLFIEHCSNSDLIIVNRCDENTEKLKIRTALLSINNNAQLIYENKNGQIEPFSSNELPYDINASKIVIEDYDFGVFCMDIMDNPLNYSGKEVRLKGQFKGVDRYLQDGFVFGRQAMVCCEDDVQLIGLICISPLANKLIPDEWLTLEGTISVEHDDTNNYDIPILHVSSLEASKPLEQPYVIFN